MGGRGTCGDLAIERGRSDTSEAPGTANASQCLGPDLCIRELDSVGKVSELNIEPECIGGMSRPSKRFIFGIFGLREYQCLIPSLKANIQTKQGFYRNHAIYGVAMLISLFICSPYLSWIAKGSGPKVILKDYIPDLSLLN
jgi:hypothetical protein